VLARSGIELLGAEHALENEQRCAHAGCAQCGSLVTERDREAIGLDGQGVCATLGAMPVASAFSTASPRPSWAWRSNRWLGRNAATSISLRAGLFTRQPQAVFAARRGCRCGRTAGR
jgi:hypothetical protein